MLDASAVVELLLRTRTGARVASRVGSADLHAPHLVDVEVTQVLRRYTRTQSIEEPEARQALLDLVSLDLTRHSHDVLLPRVWQLRDNATAYDAAYLALAEGLDATLVTCDAKLSTLPGCVARIEVI